MGGLALWRGSGGDQVHGLLSEQSTSVFDRGAPRELRHRALSLDNAETLLLQRPEDLQQTAAMIEAVVKSNHPTEPICGQEEVTKRGGPDATAKLIDEVSGIRTELRGLRESFD